jgi:PTH1 family peptidyl-tRNA hydrolase
MYEKTRHNAGFIAIDYYCNKYNIKLDIKKFDGLLFKNSEFIIVQPQTLMNLSGNCVKQIVDFYQIPIKDVLVVYDDINFGIGNFVYTPKGSCGGHNGMGNIINTLATKNIHRIKIGIEKKPEDKILSDYVLEKFTAQQYKMLESYMDEFCLMINDFLVDKPIKSFYKPEN